MSDLPIVADLIKIDQDTELVLYVNNNNKLIAASSPQYGEGRVKRCDPCHTENCDVYLVELVNSCGNKLTVELTHKLDEKRGRLKFSVRWAIKEEVANA